MMGLTKKQARDLLNARRRLAREIAPDDPTLQDRISGSLADLINTAIAAAVGQAMQHRHQIPMGHPDFVSFTGQAEKDDGAPTCAS